MADAAQRHRRRPSFGTTASWRIPAFSLKARLFLCLFLPVTALLGGIGWGVFSTVGATFEKKMQEDVELIARTLEGPITYSLARERSGSVTDALNAAFVFDRVYGAYLYDREGNLLAKAGSGRPTTREVNRFARIAEDGIKQGIYETFAGEPVFSYFVPLESETEGHLGLLQVTRNSTEMQTTLSDLQHRFILGYTLFSLFFIGLLVFGYSVSIERPLKSLQGTMRRIELGKRHVRAPVTGPTELKKLSFAFNRMLGAIEQQHAELTQMDAQEAELKRRLKSSEKMAVLGEMAGSIGHEIGTPLATIDGLAQRGLRSVREDHTNRKVLETIRNEVKRLEAFVHELISFGRAGRKALLPVNLDELLPRVIASLPAADGNARISPPPDGGPEPVVRGEALRLQIALKNVIANGLQSRPGARVTCAWWTKGRRVVLQIDDDGPGVPPEMRERIFEPFISKRQTHGGRGLGLALAERIILEHNGSIDVSEAESGGARFRIHLPLHSDRP